jgi:hypothetical protein
MQEVRAQRFEHLGGNNQTKTGSMCVCFFKFFQTRSNPFAFFLSSNSRAGNYWKTSYVNSNNNPTSIQGVEFASSRVEKYKVKLV